jgi:hypothetical protein
VLLLQLSLTIFFFFMFESTFLLRLAPPALDGTIPLQPDYNECWQVFMAISAQAH